MIDVSQFSSEFYQSLFANDEVYLIENEFVRPIVENKISVAEPVETLIETNNIVEKAPIKVEPIVQNIEPLPAPNAKVFPLLILADEATEANKVFLEKILNAVKLSLENVELITRFELMDRPFTEISKNKSYQRIISFGMPLSKINLEIMLMPYENKLIEGIWFLMAEKLVVVENDVAHKRKLWACLQEMFKA